MLTYGGIEFEEDLISDISTTWYCTHWLNPASQFPVVEINDTSYTDPVMICYYLAKQFNLLGNNAKDDWFITKIVSLLHKFRRDTSEIWGSLRQRTVSLSTIEGEYEYTLYVLNTKFSWSVLKNTEKIAYIAILLRTKDRTIRIMQDCVYTLKRLVGEMNEIDKKIMFGEIDPEPFCKIPPIDENEKNTLNFNDSIYSAKTVSDGGGGRSPPEAQYGRWREGGCRGRGEALPPPMTMRKSISETDILSRERWMRNVRAASLYLSRNGSFGISPKQCVLEGLRLQIQQTDREERRAELKQTGERRQKTYRLLCQETGGAEQKLGKLRRGVYAESPDELFKSDSSISFRVSPSFCSVFF
ncbi:unnamed protein product [Lasius platythorax]|uniref:GST N-terminal domain-containing protein n=2 Tax=Lasius platythorax TaxID=488582 RepID=A0AAV2NDJ1_9HYME